jgi:CRISPR system Cascade subunit CasE
MTLHLIEIRPDSLRLMSFLQGLGLLHDEQLGYGLHAWLKAAFGSLAPKPWRLFWDKKHPARLLAYSGHDAKALAQQLAEFAEPLVASVCPAQALASKPMPLFAKDRQLAFELLACPVGRKAGSGVEKDFFLLQLESSGEKPLSRDQVYCQWAKERLERSGGLQVLSLAATGFRLVRPLRQTQQHPRKRQTLTRPEVLFKGLLRVLEPEAFARTLARGVGRHRAFGYGMLLLRPAP